MTVRKNLIAYPKEIADKILENLTGLEPERVVSATRTLRESHNARRYKNSVEGEEVRKEGELTKARLKLLKEEGEKRKVEHDRQLKERLDMTHTEDSEKAKRRVQEQADRNKQKEERERERKQAAKEWKANQKARAASAEALRQANTLDDKQKEAQRHARVKTVIGELDRILSDDPLSAKLKAFVNTFTTNAESTLILEALDRLESRTFQHKSKWQPKGTL
jgi:hypothetical protein